LRRRTFLCKIILQRIANQTARQHLPRTSRRIRYHKILRRHISNPRTRNTRRRTRAPDQPGSQLRRAWFLLLPRRSRMRMPSAHRLSLSRVIIPHQLPSRATFRQHLRPAMFRKRLTDLRATSRNRATSHRRHSPATFHNRAMCRQRRSRVICHRVRFLRRPRPCRSHGA